MYILCVVFFFFFKQKTAYEMRISDWSSDVCSSDLQVFTCLKFRTMVHEPDADFCQAHKNDARITRVGALLRRTNLDEIPQFVNVLLGDMSVIGPRPHVQELDGTFMDLIPDYV